MGSNRLTIPGGTVTSHAKGLKILGGAGGATIRSRWRRRIRVQRRGMLASCGPNLQPVTSTPPELARCISSPFLGSSPKH